MTKETNENKTGAGISVPTPEQEETNFKVGSPVIEGFGGTGLEGVEELQYTTEEEGSPFANSHKNIGFGCFQGSGLERLFGKKPAEGMKDFDWDSVPCCRFEDDEDEDDITDEEVVAFTSGVVFATGVIATVFAGVFLAKKLKKLKQSK